MLRVIQISQNTFEILVIGTDSCAPPVRLARKDMPNSLLNSITAQKLESNSCEHGCSGLEQWDISDSQLAKFSTQEDEV